MKERKKLTIQMASLFLIIFVVFGVILVDDKLAFLKIPKVTEKIDTYLNEKYSDTLENFKIEDVSYKNLKYERKIISKENDNLYFYVYYQNKNITDSYKEDYLEGNTIITYQENKIQSNIKKITKNTHQIHILNTLDKYTPDLREKIITSTNPESLDIYNLETKIKVSHFTSKKISTAINSFINNLESKEITPKNYTLTITSTEDSKKTVKINNITNDLIENNELETVISDIINNRKSNLLDVYNIDYEYLS